MDDLQKSEVVIAKILNQLAELGLQSCELKFDELKLDDTFKPFFFVCSEWLVDEGIIRCKSITKYTGQNGGVDGFLNTPVITSYGFALLRQEFFGAKGSGNLSEAIKDVADGTKGYSQIGDFVGGILGGFTKSISS